MARESYDHTQIEPAARELWKELDLYRADLTDSTKDPYYLLFEFPYPSGDLHLGHWYAFALTDIYARKLRMEGKNVLFPVGFDAFGLPAENAAIKHGLDPKKWTYENMERMRAQIDSMGASMDWSKEVITCDPSYYKWTQWLFTKFYEHGLAERRLAAVKWCPNDQTVLANEQVNDGHCERCGAEVEDKNLTQWFLLITKYADRLLKDLDPLPWREEIKDAQRAWIGESEGAKLTFPIVLAGENVDIEIFTTRPDTIFGATYLVLAPEHPEVEKLLTHATNSDAVRAYQRETGKKTERERSENKEKTGVKLEGISAINPAAKEEIPVYIADYVLASYGTGAVMAVPAHDERDFEFAKKHGLPIKQVIEPKFVSTKGDEAFRPGEEIVHREAVCAVVRNPKDDTYLCISWKGMEMRGQVTGGIEEGEDIVEAARREVLEETGYKNLKHIERPDYTINTFFYHRMKKVNRWAHFHYVFFELENDEREPLAAEEEAMHDVVWTKSSDLRSFFTVFEGDFVADLVDKTDLLYTGDGILKDSGTFDGRENREAMGEMVDAIGGEHVKQYRIRDWSVGRQRYWGCPIPIVYDPEGNPHPIPQEHLPWLLPTDVDFTPGAAGAGKSPLASSTELHERVTRIFGEGWTPEYDTLDTFVDSSWYFLRYLDPKDDHDFSDQELMKKWMPVDRYSGGSEHTTMHLLYARFFTKVLYDLALCPVAEPFAERFNRGLILGPDGQKMSKSKGNVLNPDDFVAKYGADAVRIYLAFIGPYNEPGNYPWNLDGVVSMRRFLERVYALSERMDDSDPSHEVKRSLALAVHKVGSDIDRFKYNTAVSALMVLVRELENLSQVPREAFRTLLLLLASFAPHLTEHLWKEIGEQGSIHGAAWPNVDESLLTASEVTLAVQVNGKKRGEIRIAPDADQESALAVALQEPGVERALAGAAPSKVIYVPGRILNLVA